MDGLTIVNYLVTDNTGYGFNMVGLRDFTLVNCDFHNNTLGNFNNMTGLVAAAIGLITTGSTLGDYVNSGSGNYNLKFASPANRAGIPLPANIGAYQTNTPPVGGLIF